MANLTSSSPREFFGPPGLQIAFPMSANSQVFAGAALMSDSSTGFAVSAAANAAQKFLGFAVETKDNRTGSVFGGTGGSTDVKIVTSGMVWLDVAKGSAIGYSDQNAQVYCTDDNTFTLTAGTNNIIVGRAVLIDPSAIGANTGRMLVAFHAAALR